MTKEKPSDPDEVWKKTTISSKYEISSYGRVRNSSRGNVLRQRTKHGGYKTVFFQDKSHYVHRLMALSFIGNPDEGQTVDHINRKPSDNNITNIRWSTKQEQRVLCVSVETGEIKEFISLSQAAESMTSNSSFALNTIRGNISTFVDKDEEYLGRKWYYIEKDPSGEVRPIPSAPVYKVSFMNDYMSVSILRKNILVHRLVAEAFLGAPPSDDTLVNHKNGNKCDNRLENLEYATPSENTRHAYKTGLMETKKVLRICKDTGIILQEHQSVKDAVQSLGLKKSSHIGECCMGKSATAHGYRWSYPGESEKFAHLVQPARKILRICKETGTVLQEHSSIKDALTFIGGKSGSGITACCMRRQVSAYGYKWSYVGEESNHNYTKRGKCVVQMCKDTNTIITKYKTQEEAASAFNGHPSTISACCTGKRPTAYGYKWIFA